MRATWLPSSLSVACLFAVPIPAPGPLHSRVPLPPETVAALVRAIELKDGATAHHTWRVVLYARAMAEAFGLDHDRIARITVGAALHDLGKIDVPDHILRKPGPLTDAEYEVVKTHAARGHERLLAMGVDDPLVLELVRHHHERIDARGYPDALPGDRIPLAARHFAVIDAFDALTSVRPYRADVGPDAAERALVELEAGVGSRYCTQCVAAMKDLYRSGRIGWILGYFNDKNPAPEFGAGPSIDRVAESLRGATP